MPEKYQFAQEWHDLHNNIPANFFWVKCVRFSPCHDRDFQKHPGDFQRFLTTFRRLQNVSKTVSRCSEDVWALLKLLKRQQSCLDLWVRCEKLSLMHEIDVFSPQVWDSRTMRESYSHIMQESYSRKRESSSRIMHENWQVYNKAGRVVWKQGQLQPHFHL